MTASEIYFGVTAAVVAISALMVVVTQNIVRAAVWLLFTLAGTSVLYFQLNSDFVGATQLIVYVGGTMVLVVFGVMLTAQGPFVTMKTNAGEWAVAACVGLLLLGVLLAVAVPAGRDFDTPAVLPPITLADGKALEVSTTERLGYAFLGSTDATPMSPLSGFPKDKGAPVRTPMAYLLPFEIVSVHLLVVLIGAAYLARAKRHVSAGSNGAHA